MPTQRVLTSGITDGKTRNVVEELSKRIAQVAQQSHDRLSALEQENVQLKSTVAKHATSLTELANGVNWATQIAVSALPPGSKTTSPIGGGGSGGGGTGGPPGPPPTSPPSGTDNGDGQAGFDAAFPSGTPPPGTPINAYAAGQIVGGVANQFAANYFSGPAVDQATLDSWRACFNNRCIFHLNAAGFQTSHYPGAGAGATYLILINIPDPAGSPNNQYAYQITNYNPTLVLTAQMKFIGTVGIGVPTTPDPGIPDGTPCP